MNAFSTGLVALAMSTDAFAAAVGKGAALHRPRFSEALRTGAIFGVIEGLTPVIGWALGLAATRYVAASAHWIAFGILAALGLHMVIAGLRDPGPVETRPQSHPFWLLAATGFATSIDAMAIGVGLALLNEDIVTAAVAIGVTTLVMVTLGVMIGRVLGAIAGKRAEIVGGLLLIGVGASIVFEHLAGRV